MVMMLGVSWQLQVVAIMWVRLIAAQIRKSDAHGPK
jgi:hypothetical protein